MGYLVKTAGKVNALKTLLGLRNVAGSAAGAYLLSDLPIDASRAYIENTHADVEDMADPENAKAVKALAKHIQDRGIGIQLWENLPGGPNYTPHNHTINLPRRVPWVAGTMAHELGHAAITEKVQELFGDTGQNIRNKAAIDAFNISNAVTPTAALVPAMFGKLKASKRIGALGAIATLPRLLEELGASVYGAKKMNDLGVEGGAHAFWGLPTYMASPATMLAPWAAGAAGKAVFRKAMKLRKLRGLGALLSATGLAGKRLATA